MTAEPMQIQSDIRVRVDPKNAPRLSWHPVNLDGKEFPYFICTCGERGPLCDHDITGEGMVVPSVMHDCGFHETIQLVGWPGWEFLQLEVGLVN